MQLSSIYNIGVGSLADPFASKVKISNIVTLITCTVALSYSLFFLVVLEQPKLAMMNLGFVLAYASGLYLTHLKQYSWSKLWFFILLMLHILVLTTYIFTPSASFHFYYLLLPCGIFLIFDDNDTFEKLFVMMSGSALFFYCHGYSNPSPVVNLSDNIEQTIFISAMTVILLEIYFVMSLFSRAISRHREELNLLATIDPLTGVNNRRTLMAMGQEFIEFSKRYNKPFSVIMMDVDHFKKINDTYGHLNGDIVLRELARTLKNNIRASDIVARYGGEEFVIVLPETSTCSASDLAEQLRTVINQSTTLTDEGQHITWSASFGIATHQDTINTFSSLLNNADKALYEAKDTGRNKVCLYQE